MADFFWAGLVFDERFELSVDAWGKTWIQYRVLDPSGANFLLMDGRLVPSCIFAFEWLTNCMVGLLSSANVRRNDDVFITDQPFANNIVLSWELGQIGPLVFVTAILSGRQFYEPVSSVFDANNGEYLPQWSEAPSGRLPPYPNRSPLGKGLDDWFSHCDHLS